MVVETKDLELNIKGSAILHPLSLAVDEGEVVCIAGRNGAGKTTFLRCLVGLEPDCHGSVIFPGRHSRKDILQNTGVLIGGPSLYSYLSGRENLDIIRRYYGLARAVVNETLELTGLQDAGSKTVKTYSSGMKQRLALGMAFIHRPSLLLLDEPLTALDPEAVVDIRRLIQKLNREFGTTFIITSHSLEEIAKVFTRVIIMRKGRVVLDEGRESVQRFRQIQGSIKAVPFNRQDTTRGIFCRIEDEKIVAIGQGEMLDDFRKKTGDQSVSWSQPTIPSLEDIYLHLHSDAAC